MDGHENGKGTSEMDIQLNVAQAKFSEALRDSFDTPAAMRVISELITAYNSTSDRQIPLHTSAAIGSWVTDMVLMFGLDSQPRKTPNTIGWSGIDIPEKAKPFILPLSQLRDRVRAQAIAGKIDQSN